MIPLGDASDSISACHLWNHNVVLYIGRTDQTLVLKNNG
jgi:hypothetical protein